jgi:hypothetical protein
LRLRGKGTTNIGKCDHWRQAVDMSIKQKQRIPLLRTPARDGLQLKNNEEKTSIRTTLSNVAKAL